MGAIDTQLIREFIIGLKPEVRDIQLDDNSDLFEVGALDSYAIIMLIQTLEERLDIVFDYSDLRAFNFENLESILKLLKTKYDVK